MNDTTRFEVQPEVSEFVARVRDRLADLTDEEREELVGGLEADLSERLADRGSEVLGDPADYAAELRAAAGLGVRRTWHGPGRPQMHVQGVLDGARARWDEAVANGPAAGAWSFVVALRPLWWFFRAWLAAQLIDVSYGHDLPTPVPTLLGVWPGVLVTLAFTVVSVQVGRGAWWPGSRAAGSLTARLVLLALNAFAIVLAPLVLGQFPASGTLGYGDLDEGYVAPAAGLQDHGTFVENIFPYDAHGRPLTGVQLFDQDGEPVTVGRDARVQLSQTGDRHTVSYPYYNGTRRLWNVFPLATRSQPGYTSPLQAWTSSRPPVLPAAPLALVPPASLPAAGATPASTPRATPTARPAPTPSATAGATPSADSEKPPRR